VRTSTKGRPPLSELRLIAIGRIGRGPEAELFARYAERLRPPLIVTELADGRGDPAEIKRREAAAIRAALPSNALTIALDLGGNAVNSQALAALLTRWIESGRPVCFVIGGAEGLDGSVIARADHVLSLGPLTWPHMLARVMLAEQLFRARSIATGHPYHRAGRPG
jgi:23S rRNA (pseudouridine1915-N3)-methyltransferase